MKHAATLILILLLACCAAAAAGESAGLPDLPERLPAEYRTVLREGGGTVEKIEYPSRDYTGDGAEVTKKALVYLPVGYSEDRQYDLLPWMDAHYATWGSLTPDDRSASRDHRYMAGLSGTARCVVDRLIANGEIPPLIIVMPNGRSTANYGNTGYGNMQSFYTFGREIRGDLLPWMDAHYATWGSLTPDDLSASRDHRYMAGLSMGGMQTINIGLCECLDLFSAFGAFSAAPTSYPAARIASELEKFDGLSIRMFYSLCGAQDGVACASAADAAKSLPDHTARLTEANWIWQECPGAHSFAVWNLGLFNFLRILGSGAV